MVMDNVCCFLKIVILLENFLGYIFVFDVFVKELFFSFFVFIKDGYVVLLFDGFGERLVFGLVIVGEMIECYIVFGYVMRIIIGVLVFFGVDVVVQVEDIELLESDGDGKIERKIKIFFFFNVGVDIRLIGFDVKKGEQILICFEKFGFVELGLMVLFGLIEIEVF